MFVPTDFAETRTPVLHELIRRRPLAAVITTTAGGLEANHIPLLLEPHVGTLGLLRGHVARANPIWRDTPNGSAALALFQGPQHYISPSWYPAKREHGRVVPTWNYAVVHARGAIEWFDASDELRALLDALVDEHERGRDAPWQITDAPADFIDRMVGRIVGFRIAITELTGKWKLSQNRSAADRAGVAAGLATVVAGEAQTMADLMAGPAAPSADD
jgi:transcriptional regulator